VITHGDGSANGRLDGKVAFLAGATSGIGEVMAEMFAAEGAKVVVGGRCRSEGEAVAAHVIGRAVSKADEVHRENPSRPSWQISPRSSQTDSHARSL
jgi:NAD(P)-dependent dehydrogenase (short-subunit alcohol dehydrogenase family)